MYIIPTVSKTYTTQEMANKLYANAVQEGQDAADQAEKNAKDDTDTKLKNYSTTVEMNSAINQAADSISLEVSKKYAEPSNRKKRGLYVAGKKETAVRNRTETAPNNKSSCVAKKQAVVVAWTHPEKCGIPL